MCFCYWNYSHLIQYISTMYIKHVLYMTPLWAYKVPLRLQREWSDPPILPYKWCHWRTRQNLLYGGWFSCFYSNFSMSVCSHKSSVNIHSGKRMINSLSPYLLLGHNLQVEHIFSLFKKKTNPLKIGRCSGLELRKWGSFSFCSYGKISVSKMDFTGCQRRSQSICPKD